MGPVFCSTKVNDVSTEAVVSHSPDRPATWPSATHRQLAATDNRPIIGRHCPAHAAQPEARAADRSSALRFVDRRRDRDADRSEIWIYRRSRYGGDHGPAVVSYRLWDVCIIRDPHAPPDVCPRKSAAMTGCRAAATTWNRENLGGDYCRNYIVCLLFYKFNALIFYTLMNDASITFFINYCLLLVILFIIDYKMYIIYINFI